jgi:hypothetical protein
MVEKPEKVCTVCGKECGAASNWMGIGVTFMPEVYLHVECIAPGFLETVLGASTIKEVK